MHMLTRHSISPTVAGAPACAGRRHALVASIAGSGKSGILNVILGALTACPDVLICGIDLKGGMELRPWASCLDRIATTPREAADLLTDAVTILDTRATTLTRRGRLAVDTNAGPVRSAHRHR
jgi:hypothetical protein